MITVTTRRDRTNGDCPKCGGHVWHDDIVNHYPKRRVRRWWHVFGPWCDRKVCPDTEHLHRTDRCARCGWAQTYPDETSDTPPV